MNDLITELDAIRSALGTLSITSSRRNLDILLGSMQALDRVIMSIQNMIAAEKEA